LFGVDVWSKAMHQSVSDGHVDNVGRSQLELKCINVDVTQHKAYKVILRVVSILNESRQHVNTCIAWTSMLITAKPNSLSNVTTTTIQCKHVYSIDNLFHCG